MIPSIALAFGTGVLQVFLVALNVRQIAGGGKLIYIFLVGIGISLCWIFNVRAAISGLGPALAYALGAGVGTVLAMQVRMRVRNGA